MKNYLGIQSLRALGALLVVIFHATNAVRDRVDASAWQFNAGMAGVDLFFVISGFIMVMATKQFWFSAENAGPSAANHFLRRRLIRIVPLYWMATTLKLAMVLLIPSVAVNTQLETWHTISSYLFIPAWNINHEAFPLLVPGWTLSFEMFFYLLFAGALLLRKQPVYWLTPILLLLAIFGYTQSPVPYAVMTLLDWKLLEFGMGMWVALLILKNRMLSPRLAKIVALFALFSLLSINGAPAEVSSFLLFLVRGISSAVLVFAIASLEGVRSFWHHKLFAHLGDASYAMYLFHPFIVGVIGMVLAKLNLPLATALPVTIVVSLFATCIAGLLIYRWVEKPTLNYLRKRYA